MTSLYLTTIDHRRKTPVKHTFQHRSVAFLVELDRLGRRRCPADLPWPWRRLLRFDSADHLGDSRRTWHDNVVTFAAKEGIDIRGGTVLALTTPRALGRAFNPLTLYWCRDADDDVQCVIAEVHNTYGERHCYLLHPDGRSVATAEKAFYVSPFNEVNGSYQLCVPQPGDSLNVSVTLRRADQQPFAASWRGHRVDPRQHPGALLRAAVTPYQTSMRIYAQGIRLWLRRLPVVPRPAHTPQEDV